MSPFDSPPSTPPVSFDPPESPRRSRRRSLAVGAASVGLVAAGALVVSQLASADESQPVARAAVPGDETIGTTPPPPTTAPPSDPDEADDADATITEVDGKIVIRINDDEPIVIDLGDLGELGDLGDLGRGDLDLGDLDLPDDLGELPALPALPDLGRIEECLGHPLVDTPDGSLPALPDVFGDGGTITITGPDGVSVFDLGDGDGSVTITKENGEITVTSEGDLEVTELTEGLGDALDDLPMPSLPDLDELFDCLESTD
jgi:hypothetical protein